MSTSLQNLNFIISLTDRMSAPLGKVLKNIDGIQNRFNNGALTAGAGLGGLFGVKSAFESLTENAISFEKEMANVSKATNQPLDLAMKGLGHEILKLGRSLPVVHEELAKIMATGAKSNIPTAQLSKYTELVAKVSTAWETAAEETSINIAKLSNIFQKPILQMGRFTDAINSLDDDSVSSAPQIVDVLNRIGGGAMAIKMTELQSAALSTTMLDLGETSEKAGTGINALLERIGTPALQKKTFANTLLDIGWSVEKMEHAVKTSGAQTTILALFDTISKFGEQDQRNILGGLFGSEYADTLSKLAGRMDIYRDRIRLVSNEQNYLNSVNKEFDNRMSATQYKLDVLGNRFNELKVGTGGVLVDILDKAFPDLFKGMDTLNDKFATFTDRHPLLTKIIGYSIVALGGLVGVLSLVAIAWGVLTIAAIPFLMPLLAITAAVGLMAWGINAGAAAFQRLLEKTGAVEWLAGKWGLLKAWWFDFKAWLTGFDLYSFLLGKAVTFAANIITLWLKIPKWWQGFKDWLASLNPFGVLLSGIDNVINKITGIGTALRSAMSAGAVSIPPPISMLKSNPPRNIIGALQGKGIGGGNTTSKSTTINVHNNGRNISGAQVANELLMQGG